MKKILISLLKVIGISAAVSALLMIVFSFVMLKTEVSDTMLRTFVIVIYVASTFVGGMIMGKVMQARKFLWGMGCGLIYFAIVLALSFAMKGTESVVTLGPLVCLVACMTGGTIGGMAG